MVLINTVNLYVQRAEMTRSYVGNVNERKICSRSIGRKMSSQHRPNAMGSRGSRLTRNKKYI